MAADSKRLSEIYEHLAIIGSTSAEARAASILNGLQFSNEMQVGWLMVGLVGRFPVWCGPACFAYIMLV